MKKVLATIFFVSILAPLAFSQIRTAKVTGGEVEGVVTDGISIFKGIPFAAPPVGDLRWRAPAPVLAWTGVKKADAFGPACMQTANATAHSPAKGLVGALLAVKNDEDPRLGPGARRNVFNLGRPELQQLRVFLSGFN